MTPSRSSGFRVKHGWAFFLFFLATAGATFAGNHVVAWGDLATCPTNVPAGATNVQAIAAGRTFCLALESDSTVLAWGTGNGTNTPAGLSNVVAIAAGGGQGLALKNDGTLAAWGAPSLATLTNIPAGLSNILAVSCGDDHNLVLKSDGTIYAWGENYSHQTNILAGLSNVVAIAAGDSASMAIKSDGTTWCSSGFFPTSVASQSNIVAGAIVAGGEQGVFIQQDGAALVWGINGSSVTNVPNAVAASGRSAFNQAGAAWVLQRNGTLAGFNTSYLGQSNIWMNLSNVLAIAAGYYYHAAIVGDSVPVAIEPMASAKFTNGQFVISQPTSLGRNYRLEYLDSLSGDWQIVSPLPGNGSMQTLVDPNPNPQHRFYRVYAGQ